MQNIHNTYHEPSTNQLNIRIIIKEVNLFLKISEIAQTILIKIKDYGYTRQNLQFDWLTLPEKLICIG